MKSLIPIILILFSCHIYTTWGDVEVADWTKRENINRENVYKIEEGKTTEEEIQNLFGRRYDTRLSFDPPLVKQYRKKKYEISRIISYFSTTLNKKDAMAAIEQFKLSIFLKDGIVQFYFINHVGKKKDGTWGPLGYDKYPRAKNLREKEFDGFDWPDVVCDFQFYERKVKKIWFQDKPWKIQETTWDKCDWETEAEWEEKIFRLTNDRPPVDIVYWSRKEKERKRLKDFE